MSPAPITDDERSQIAALTRIETKLDIVTGQHGAQLADHEARIRTVEDRKTVSPRGLWVAVSGGIATTFAAVQLLNLITQ